MRNILLPIMASCLIASCSSPEADGKEAAQRFCDCEKERVEKRVNAYYDFIRDFDSYDFTTRIEAREKLQEIDRDLDEAYRTRIRQADNYLQKARNKYLTNYEKNTQFEYAYNSYYNANIKVADNQSSNLMDQINRQIATIIPPDPDETKIRKDLVGRVVQEQEGGYHKYGWRWTIENGEVKDVEILGKEAGNRSWLYRLSFVVQAERGAAYSVSANLAYDLPDDVDDWRVEYLESLTVNIVKTGRYDHCISHETVQGGWLINRRPLKLTNNTTQGLQVGGRIRHDNNWEKFVVNVEGNSTQYISFGGGYQQEVHEYIIDFVELP